MAARLAKGSGRLHSEHQVRLHQHYQAELELVDDFRDFLKARARLDLDYAQSLQRLAQSHLSKLKDKLAAKHGETTVLSTVVQVYEETDSLAQARIYLSEQLTKTIVEPAKLYTRDMAIQQKRCDELHIKFENILTDKYRKTLQAQKAYTDRRKMSDAAKAKFEKNREFLESGKKSFKTLTKSKSEMQEKLAKAGEKAEQTAADAAHARNQYILMLGAMNAQLDHYYEADLPKFVDDMDGDYFDRVKEYLGRYASLDQEQAQAVITSTATLMQKTEEISKAYEELAVLKEDVFTSRLSLEFIPQGSETVRELDAGGLQLDSLTQEMQRLVNSRGRARRTIAAKEKVIGKINDMFEVFAKQSDVPAETRQESENQLYDEMFEMTAAKWEEVRCDKRIDMLASVGIPVPEEAQPGGVNGDVHGTSAEMERTSLHSAPSQVASGLLPVMSSVGRPCVALYDYSANDTDELTIREGERLVLVDDESGGWVRARNALGQDGLVPIAYVESVAEDKPVSSEAVAAARSGTVIATATALYANEEDGMLAFDEGDTIEVLEYDDKTGDGYWLGRCRGKEGHFHSELVEMNEQ